MGQENQEKEPECSELKVDSDFMDPKDPVPQKEIQEVHETIQEVGDKGKDFSANKTTLGDVELLMGIEETSTQANCFNKEQKLMDELQLVVNGTEDLVSDDGLIPLNSGLGEHNQLASEGFHPFLMFNVSTTTKGQASASVISTSSLKHESQQKEMTLMEPVCGVVRTLPAAEEGEFEKEQLCGQKVDKAMHISMNSEALNMSEDGGLLHSTILKDKHETQNEGEKLEKSSSVNNATNPSNSLIEEGDLEEGEISGDFGMDDNSFDMPSEDGSILQQMKADEVQKPKNIIGNMVYACKIGSGEKEEGYESTSFMVNSLQDANSSGLVEPSTSDKTGVAYGIKVAISRETIEYDKAGENGSALKPRNSKDRHVGNKGANDMPTNLTQNQALHRGSLEETTNNDIGNPSAVKMVDASRKRKRGPGSEEKKDKEKQMVGGSRKKKQSPGSEEKEDDIKKINYRKKRAEKNRELGVKRLKLPPVQKLKTIPQCRHYLKGRCHEGDKCQFSHDAVPLTKSKPCLHFARHSCMKGDDCPFDHQLSKYPCNNFVSKGSCSRGDACMFSHQVPTNQDILTPSNVSKPELKSPLFSGNTNFNMPLINHACSPVQQNHVTNSTGIHSRINTEHRVTNTLQKQPTPVPKGIRFIDVAKLSPKPSTPKQGMVTPNKKSLVQNETHADQNASGITQNMGEIPKKLPAATPKGINFLSFGKGPVCSFRSSISSHVNRENGIKLPQLVNFGFREQANSSLNKDDYGKVSDRTKQNVPQTDLFSNQILDQLQSVAEGLAKFAGKASIDDSMRDESHSNSVLERKKST
ncbi:Zinc finger, CCCH-type [Sesbania bispinosa]|nr:Zinc finger, CCCH-type [Sesbania bispinosa]